MHLVGFIIRICHEARSPEPQIIKRRSNSSSKFQMHRKTFISLAFVATGSKACLSSQLTVQRVLC